MIINQHMQTRMMHGHQFKSIHKLFSVTIISQQELMVSFPCNKEE